METKYFQVIGHRHLRFTVKSEGRLSLVSFLCKACAGCEIRVDSPESRALLSGFSERHAGCPLRLMHRVESLGALYIGQLADEAKRDGRYLACMARLKGSPKVGRWDDCDADEGIELKLEEAALIRDKMFTE